jgi:hypothetical protein
MDSGNISNQSDRVYFNSRILTLEYLKVYTDLGLTREEIDDFFTGPAYLAWFKIVLIFF